MKEVRVMGCDIHLYIETKNEDMSWGLFTDYIQITGEETRRTQEEYKAMYGYYESLYISRDYDLFSVLAGVRGDLEPIDYPIGFPDDCSQDFLDVMKSWGSDAHSETHYTLDKLLEYFELPENAERFRYFSELLIQIRKLKKYAEDIRLLIFFDN